MSELVEIDVAAIAPSPAQVLRAQGVAEGAEVRPEVAAVAAEAAQRFAALARPAAVVAALSLEAWREIYRGRGANQSPAPLELIAPRALHLALAAATVGQGVSDAAAARFAAGDYALGAALDAAGSLGADACGRALERWLEARLASAGAAVAGGIALGYSPGYCGWDLSGQAALFEALRPERVGVRLSPSLMMQPLKSISGVLVYGPAAVHAFDNSFPLCADCATPSCRARIARLGQGDSAARREHMT